MTNHMIALSFTPGQGAESLRQIKRPLPQPGRGEVLVRLRAASLNFRDLLVLDNRYGALPSEVIPLSDGAGEIVSLGAGVTGLSIGQRVMGAFYPDWIDGPISGAKRHRSLGANIDGALASHILLPAHAAIPTPAHLSDEEAATLPCAALTAWHALVHLAQVKPGQTVLLLGSGGVSVMALKFAKAMGARVIQTSGAVDKQARLKDLGADLVIDYQAAPDWQQAVLEATGGEGADAVIEVGGPGTLQRSFQATRHGGTIATIGFVANGGGVDPRPIISRSLRVMGLTVGSCAMFHEMNRAISALQLRPVIGETLSMGEAAHAFDRLRAGAHFGKIVLRIDT